MKKTVIAVAVAGLCLMSAAQAAPQDNTWYLGGKLGWSQFQSPDYNDAITTVANEDKNDVGGGAFLGYQLNPYVGFELGYDYLGKMAYDFVLDPGDPVLGEHLKAQGAQFSVKLGYPVTDALDLYGRLGGMYAWVDGAYDDSANGMSPLVAAGLEYAIDRDWAARLEYQWVHGLGDTDDIGSEANNGLLAVGISYRFGQAAPVLPPPAPAPEPVKVSKDFALSSDVLFDFNKASLKPEGSKALDNLYGQIQAETPQSDSTVVIGYTDRIGSDKYNQGLSEKRAKSVADYLVKKGIPADKIKTEGKGEAEPVTGTQCDGVKGTKKLIACLAPDRRVIITVTGTKEVTQ